MHILGTNLQYLMTKHNINKNQLSKIISVGPSIVGKWINNEITDLKLTSIISLATFFNISLDTFVFCNIEAQEKLIKNYSEYEYIKLFEWNKKFDLSTTKSLKVPHVLIHENVNDIFTIDYPSDYEGIFPSKSILLLKKDVILNNNDILLVQNKILKNNLFLFYDGSVYNSILTNELVDIEQYNIEGILINIIFDKVFFNL